MNTVWYPHFMADYESDTQHLSLMEHGAYRLLLDYYYKKGQPLPANASILHRVCRAFAADEQAAVQSVLEQFFVLEDDGWHQKRADSEIEKARSISAKRSAAASVRYKEGKNLQEQQDASRSQKTPENLSNSEPAKALQLQSKSSANALQMHPQLTTHNKEEKDPAAKPPRSVLDQFTDLVEFRGGSREGAGSFLGKALKSHPRDEVEKAAALTVTANAQDPKAYMRSVLEKTARRYISQAEMNRAGGGVVL